MKFDVATPLSTLFRDAADDQRGRILDLSDVLEMRDIDVPCESGLPYLYHCEHSIVESWTEGVVKEIAKKIDENGVVFASFHAHSCYVKPRIENGTFIPTGKQMTEDEMIANAVRNVHHLREKIGNSVELGVENNNYFKTGAYEIVTEPSFLEKLCTEADVGFLLDVGHAEISAYHIGFTLNEYVEKLPLMKARQIHLSGITREKTGYKDSHAPLDELDWQQFAYILPLCPNVSYVTIEYYKDVQKLISMLEKLRTYRV